jgi:hypothetical protein
VEVTRARTQSSCRLASDDTASAKRFAEKDLYSGQTQDLIIETSWPITIGATAHL